MLGTYLFMSHSFFVISLYDVKHVKSCWIFLLLEIRIMKNWNFLAFLVREVFPYFETTIGSGVVVQSVMRSKLRDFWWSLGKRMEKREEKELEALLEDDFKWLQMTSCLFVVKYVAFSRNFYISTSIGYGINQDSILPDLVFLCFLIFAFKLSHFVTQDNNANSIKLPSVIAKNGKMFVKQRGKFGRIDSRSDQTPNDRWAAYWPCLV